MGCSNPQEKLEEEIMDLNINKIELQMEKYKQMQLLGKNINQTEKNNKINNNNNINNKKIITDNNNVNNANNNNQAKRKSTALKTGKGIRSKSMKSIRINGNTIVPKKKDASL